MWRLSTDYFLIVAYKWLLEKRSRNIILSIFLDIITENLIESFFQVRLISLIACYMLSKEVPFGLK